MPSRPGTTPSRRRPDRRQGFTLAEMMISVTILMLVFAMAVPFFRAQARSVETNAQRLDARTGGRYGASSLDRDVRVAGIDTPAEQPVLVQAQGDAITVNGNLLTRDTSDVFSVYVNPDADPTATGSLTSATPITLPNSSWTYPAITYRDEANALSKAETISYWVAADPDRPGFSALYRRVNREEPRVVVRNLIVTDTLPVFRYFYVAPDGRLTQVANSLLPMRHSVPRHGDAADTGRAGFIDSVRVVRVRLQTVARDDRTGQVDTLTQESSIRIMNAGLLKRTSCGELPRAPSWRSAPSPVTVVNGSPVVELAFEPSADEGGGERDVMRYVLYRRDATDAEWGEPIGSIVANGSEAYPLQDRTGAAGARYQYGVAAMDCTPRLSDIALFGAIIELP